MYSFSKFIHYEAKSKFIYKRPLSERFKVFVNGEEAPVYTSRISKYPFNTVWPGHQRPFNQTEEASFVNIVSDEAIKIEVETLSDYERIILKPYSKNIIPCEENGKITFTLNENGFFALQLDSYHNMLYIFNSKPISAPERDDVTYYYGPGIHFPGTISLKSNESVYIDKDALVYGNILAEDAENLHIFGNGLLDDSHEERTGNYCYEDYTVGNMRFYDCKNVSVEGVAMTNSAEWCVSLFGCYDFSFDGIKIFGQWRYNTDGVDIVNCQNIFIKNSFIHSFDDTVTIKGIDRYCKIDNVNIHTEGCVLWCDWGKCCEVGVETACREYKNISFKNCDVLRGGTAVLDINNGDCAEISNVVFENINVEYNSFDTQEVYQSEEEQVYDAVNTQALPRLVLFGNNIWRSEETMRVWGLPPLTDIIDLDGIRRRHILNVKVKNINVYYDKGLPLENGQPRLQIVVENAPDTEKFENIDISDIYVNGAEYKL